MTTIEEAKQQLPLPDLMAKLDLANHAKKKAKCPFHDDGRASFSIWRNPDGQWLFKCHAGCGEGDEVSFLALHKQIPRNDAFKLYLEMAGGLGELEEPKKNCPFPWEQCADAFTEKHRKRLAEWRGYSDPFCSWLVEQKLIGIWQGCTAFPVHGGNADVIGAHCRPKSGDRWFYTKGATCRPLIIGSVATSDRVHVFESQWDAFAVADKLGLHETAGEAIIITRGAANGAAVAGLIPASAQVIAWKQNDVEKNGKRAGDQWLAAVVAHAGAIVKCVVTPPSFKDPNEWIKAGKAGYDDLLRALTEAKPVVGDNSPNSPLLSFELREDYPPPLAPRAFHGIAGEIVRRIEPHTEADPAALLFQFLTAFGNVIGHDHYFLADGARHHLSLFGVLVGQSSKGRKGTSWNHIARLMQRIDPNWLKNCVTNGLSSGEGLIWAVRDPIEETRPIREKGRHNGEYETIIANQGEADKRLLIIEGEFANVLKVMSREGNTLSPIIRSAWDTGNLRTMVKNSPATATGAHISIVGHITRDELRRLLTQTESANGFANRFNWLAVRRSKCLPEGGAIDSINFDDVLEELQAIISFAEDFLELTRDAEAKELWRTVYPHLSEGKPGMAGAVTGRAEAQVMRFAAIYALLDKSQLIRRDHLQAALALWEYCEQSAAWIFGTSTGDRNADKILRALQHATAGMTKTEISVSVFNRHASSADIDEALRLLHGLKMVIYRVETTGGAPAQRWFVAPAPSERSE